MSVYRLNVAVIRRNVNGTLAVLPPPTYIEMTGSVVEVSTLTSPPYLACWLPPTPSFPHMTSYV